MATKTKAKTRRKSKKSGPAKKGLRKAAKKPAPAKRRVLTVSAKPAAPPPPPPQTPWCWHELMTPDTRASRGFYSGLLGWGTREMSMGPGGTYTLWSAGGQDVGGMMALAGEAWKDFRPQWMTYVAVDDVDAKAKRATELGGKVCVPPSDIPGIGRFSVLADPTGALFSLYKSANA
jgi:predicted enzyme related to lactoylglutathione lyase